MYLKYIKGKIDLILAAILIILFLWLLIMIIIAIKLTSNGPVFFKQKRIGLNKKEFVIYKFRTMKLGTPKDIPTHLLSNPEQYITAVGRILRKTSLDELPQLINILNGDMSFVGPRPALWNQYDLVVERDKYKANDIKPGLTGWAQVNGRDEIPTLIKAKLDGEYIKRVSLLFDAYCLIRTVRCVIRRDGIKEGGIEVTEAYEENTSDWC